MNTNALTALTHAILCVAGWTHGAGIVAAQQIVPAAQAEELLSDEGLAPRPARRYALIVVGIPGDEEHRQRFEQTTDTWRRWLTEIAGVKDEDVTLLVGREQSDQHQPATSESIQTVIGRLSQRINAQDSLWVFLLGHGSQDQRHGWFHLPGAHLNSAQWAGLFAALRSKEQVFWLTHSASGSFLKPMSLPDRIVITATDADGEVNEPRFPHVLAEIMLRQLDETDDVAGTDSTPARVLDLFQATTRQVNQAFEDEQLVPTEHAQLDDNGDGEGTEIVDLAAESNSPTDASSSSLLDGLRAGRVSIRLQPITKSNAAVPASPDLPLSPAEDEL